MLKRLMILLLVFMPCLATAETYSGTVIASDIRQIIAPSSGILLKLDLTEGQRIETGDECGRVSVQKVFATENGTVDKVYAENGEKADGTVVSVAPVSRYTVYCTISGAYEYEDTQFIHIGEYLWMACTEDGTHLATGNVIKLSGKEYTVEVNSGELYIGETVYLYRDAGRTDEQRVGIGTVTQPDPKEYSADGYVSGLRIHEGENIEKGQLLFSVGDSQDAAIISNDDGIVTDILVLQGTEVNRNDVIAQVAGSVLITFTFGEDDISLIKKGMTVSFIRADDETDTRYTGRIIGISRIADGEGYKVTVEPENNDLPIGLSVSIETEER